MLPYLALILAIFTLPTGNVARADELVLVEVPQGELGGKYRRKMWFSGVKTRLVYVDPSVAEIPTGNATQLKKTPDKDTTTAGKTSPIIALIAGGILAIILYLFWKFGGAAQLNTQKRDEAAGQKLTPHHPEINDDNPVDEFLQQIAGMADKRTALILLVGRALHAAAGQNTLPLTRSDTAREILGRLPKSWPHFSALQKLVSTEELVQFGGRVLADATFEDCLSAAHPILFRGRR